MYVSTKFHTRKFGEIASFYKQHFYKQHHAAEKEAKTKQHSEAELLLFEI